MMPENEAAGIPETTSDALAELEAFLEANSEKKSPSRKDSKEFAYLWGRLVDERGLAKSMPLLCRGFNYCAAAPLYEYVKGKGCAANEYALIETYPSVRNSKNEMALRISLSLFANELIAPTTPEAMDTLVKKVVATACNKEGKLSGNFGSYVKKLVVAPIGGNKISDDATCTLDSQAIKPFIALLSPHLASIIDGGASAKEMSAALGLRAWLESFSGGKEGKPETGHSETIEPAEHSVGQAGGDKGQQAGEVSLDQVIGYVVSQQKRIESSHAALKSLRAEVSRLKEQKAEAARREGELNEALTSAKERARALKEELDEQTARAAKLEADLAAAKEFADVAKMTADKENAEAIVRISRKLKPDYQSYTDALDVEMDAQLGQIMMDSLGAVFETLKKSGFDL